MNTSQTRNYEKKKKEKKKRKTRDVTRHLATLHLHDTTTPSYTALYTMIVTVYKVIICIA